MIGDQLTGEPASGSPTIRESVRRLEQFLRENVAAGRHAVVVVDEAHLLLESDSLQTLRLLLNFESDAQAPLTLILVGQASLLPVVETHARFRSALVGTLSLAALRGHGDRRLRAAPAAGGGQPTKRSSMPRLWRRSIAIRTASRVRSTGCATWRCSWASRKNAACSKRSRCKRWLKSWLAPRWPRVAVPRRIKGGVFTTFSKVVREVVEIFSPFGTSNPTLDLGAFPVFSGLKRVSDSRPPPLGSETNSIGSFPMKIAASLYH